MKPKIVITKNLNLYPDQLKRIKLLWEIKTYDNEAESEKQWLERCKNADIICTGMFGFKSEELYKLDNTFVSLPFVGVEYLDLTRLKAKNIQVSNAPGCNKEAVSEWFIWMLLMIQRNLHISHNSTNIPRDTLLKTGWSLWGKNITILGKGNIWEYLWKICNSFWMGVSYFWRWDNLIESVKSADIIANTLSVNKASIWLLDNVFFENVKPGCIFISAARHQTYDIKALKGALDNWTISIAIDDAADSRVWDTNENIYQELLWYKNMYVTPHIAWNAESETRKANDIMIDNIEAWLHKNPINLITN